MKKNIQDKLFEMMKTMKEASESLPPMLKYKQETELVELLTEMQTFAIEIGNKIEELLGEGTRAVAKLEELCELIWRCSQEESIKRKEDIIAGMNKVISEIEQELKEMPVSYDVVFLPYKASMWDSMESVWRAAKEDEQCNCYVIPIPYYDKNKDGTLGKMNYEGKLFPDDVPITHYDSYSIEASNPEIIYIHNPYDDFNHITTVAPQYYSKELKKYTKMLVYIPYYCTDGGLAGGHEQFVSYYMADKIILQNERIKEQIFEHNDALPEEKLVALGSPKFDRMVYLDQNKPELIDEWKEILPDKKVFLYNTSIAGILNEGDKFLDKMESIFKVFQGRDDVALIWRPHPLLYSTLEAMRPELARRYQSLKEWYIAKKIGVYDTTADVNNSIAISDAYIGEGGSSIVHLAGVVGKPIFITGEEVYEQEAIEELTKVEFMDCAVEGNLIWFVTMGSHLLCQIDTDTGKIEVLGKVPETEDITGLSYVNIMKYQDRLIMMPYSAKGICEYDLLIGQFSKYYFTNQHVSLNFGRMISYKNYLYLTPQEYPAILRYNLENREITYYHECIEDVKSKIKKKYGWPNFVWGTYSYNNLLFITSFWSNHVLIFDMDTEEYDIQEVGDKDNLYRGIVADETYCWLILQNRDVVVRWNRITGETIEYDKYPEGFVSGQITFKNIIKFEDRIFLVPFHSNHAVEMNADTGKMRYTPWDVLNRSSSIDYDNNLFYHFGKKISNRKFCVYQLDTHSYIEIDIIDGVKKESVCRIEKRTWINEAIDEYRYQQLKNINSPITVFENNKNLLIKFIEYVKSDKHDKERIKRLYDRITEYADGSSGIHIHQYIKECVK